MTLPGNYHARSKNCFAHGIMFHHFHDEGSFYKSEGSISAEEFQEMIDFIGLENILSPQEWLALSRSSSLKNEHVCFTFDDALKCQIEVALPVMNRNRIKGFFFVYSSVFQGNLERLELFRYLRNVCYPNVDAFYEDFYKTANRSEWGDEISSGLKAFPGEAYLSDFPFYSLNDRRYRYVRDKVLGPVKYNRIVDSILQDRVKNISEVAKLIWMTDRDIRNLHEQGHCVGLHSYSHPMQMCDLSSDEQRSEYTRNKMHLRSIMNVDPIAMSHPCNSYSAITLSILRDLGIELGFCANVRNRDKSILEYPREDHANVIKFMQ